MEWLRCSVWPNSRFFLATLRWLPAFVICLVTCLQTQAQRAPWERRLAEIDKLEASNSLAAAASRLDQLLADAAVSLPPGEQLRRLLWLAETRIALGDYQRAEAAARNAISVARRERDKGSESEALHLAGVGALYSGDYASALLSLEAALAIDVTMGDLERQAIRTNNIGNANYFMGNYGEALRAYQRAYTLVTQPPIPPDRDKLRLAVTNSLAALFQRLGQHRTALDYYRQIEFSLTLLPPEQQTIVLGNLGALYRNLGDPYTAIDKYREAQKLYRTGKDRVGEISVLTNIGVLQLLETRVPGEAAATFGEALKAAKTGGNRREEAQLLLYLAECERQQGRLSEAESLFRRGDLSARELGLAEEEWKAHLGLGRVAGARGDWSNARKEFEIAVEQVESLRTRMQASSLRRNFLADKRAPYDELIAWHLDARAQFVKQSGSASQDSAATLLPILERARARNLQDLLDRATSGNQDAGTPEHYRMTALRKEIAELRGKGEAASARIPALENEYLQLESAVWGSFPTQPRKSLRIEAIQGVLDRDSILLEYWIGPERAAVVWVTRNESGAMELPWGDAGRSDVEALQRALRDARSEWQTSAESVAQRVLPRALRERLRLIRRIWIVSDGKLATIPFEVLPVDSLLVEKAEISYLPASALLLRTELQRPKPWLPWASSVHAVGAPLLSQELSGETAFTALPGAMKELEMIARLVPGTVRVDMGKDARKSQLMQAFPNPPVLHLATHAIVDEQDSERSRIVFSSDDNNGDPEYLYLREIPLLHLQDVQLITLSACDTARGRLLAGEGVQDLSSAFLAAGAGSIVSTLWAVDDGTTAQLIAQFYGAMAKGSAPASALREAQLALFRSGTFLAHPYYWAGFVLQGRGDASLAWPRSWSWWLGLAAAACLTFSALLWWSRRTATRPQ